MKYKISTDIIKQICYYRGLLLNDDQKALYFKKLIFTNAEIEFGFRVIDIDIDIELYISKNFEEIIDLAIREYQQNIKSTNDEEVFIPPRRFLLEPYASFYNILD